MRHPALSCGLPGSLLLLGLLATACGDDSKEPGKQGQAPKDTDDQADTCIPSKEAGDHVFECNGLTFLTKVDESCLEKPCGLIFDVHGFSMSGQQMRDNTQLHELAPKAGYITVHPSAPGAAKPDAEPKIPGGAWSEAEYPHVLDFMERTIRVFDVDPNRVHITGFSQGGALTWWFLCNHSDLLASAAPNAAAGIGGAETCISENWAPRVPILYMNGETDTASTIDSARELVSTISSALSLTDEGEIDGDEGFTRTRYADDKDMSFEYVEHKYGGQVLLAGHCIPGGVDIEGAENNYSVNATTCTEGDINIHWGEMVLDFFQKHPKRVAK